MTHGRHIDQDQRRMIEDGLRTSMFLFSRVHSGIEVVLLFRTGLRLG